MEFPDQPFDYVFLQEQLKDYSNPRDKISRLIKDGSLIRIKKGLYIRGEKQNQIPVQLETLANLIYGPSYVSYEYALAYYDLIPERVFEITSVTTQRNKLFNTPVGRFSYQHLSLTRYEIGIIQANNFLIASKEKALADTVARQKTFKNWKKLLEFLIESLRIDEEELRKLDAALLQNINSTYKNTNVRLLKQLVEKL